MRIRAIVIVFPLARPCSRSTASGRSGRLVRGNFARIDLQATHAGLARWYGEESTSTSATFTVLCVTISILPHSHLQYRCFLLCDRCGSSSAELKSSSNDRSFNAFLSMSYVSYFRTGSVASERKIRRLKKSHEFLYG